MKYLFKGEEISQDKLKYYRPVEWENNYQIVILRELTTEEKIEELTNWFNTYFQQQLIQSIWQTNFKISKDPYFRNEDGELLSYKTIDDLKIKGEEVRAEIKRLRNLL